MPRTAAAFPTLESRIEEIAREVGGEGRWDRIVFTRDADGACKVVPLEDLLEYLSNWGR